MYAAFTAVSLKKTSHATYATKGKANSTGIMNILKRLNKQNINVHKAKRYRSNLINWGMLPFQLNGAAPFGLGDYILIPHVREALKGDLQNIPAYVLGEEVKPFALYMAPLTSDEREIPADGCLINYYKH